MLEDSGVGVSTTALVSFPAIAPRSRHESRDRGRELIATPSSGPFHGSSRELFDYLDHFQPTAPERDEDTAIAVAVRDGSNWTHKAVRKHFNNSIPKPRNDDVSIDDVRKRLRMQRKISKQTKQNRI
jgi:hypothetical protein